MSPKQHVMEPRKRRRGVLFEETASQCSEGYFLKKSAEHGVSSHLPVEQKQPCQGPATAVPASSAPLSGVIVCLSGFMQEEKEKYHNLVEKLGGTFTRDLDVTRNTHLVAFKPEGAKYDAACAANNAQLSCHRRSKEAHFIELVQGSWLESCEKTLKRVEEGPHRFDNKLVAKKITTSESLPTVSLVDSLNEQIEPGTTPHVEIFATCNFFLVGFDEEVDPVNLSLGRLIRRGLGTIFWEFHEGITHVIVNDHASEAIEEAAKLVRLQFPDGPVFVSPPWVIHSWKVGELQDSNQYPPLYGNKVEKPEKPDSVKDFLATKKKIHSTLFRGSFFVLMRISPPSWTVDFDSDDLERQIRSNGGQLLSMKMVDALKVDATAKTAQLGKRTCYVIGWGSYSQAHLEIHPLLAQVKRNNLCELVEVTPLWLKTCLAENKILKPSRLPVIFTPFGRPFQTLTSAEATESLIRISVTGFSGSRRTAIIQLIHAIGAFYDDSMRPSTTHLICREPTGQKYEKALEWKLHIVSVDWLYHIAKNGYSDKGKMDCAGCEFQFQLMSGKSETS